MTQIGVQIEATRPTPAGEDGLRELTLYEQLKARIESRIASGYHFLKINFRIYKHKI